LLVHHPLVPCRPDELKKSLQAKYGMQVKAAIYDLLEQPELIADGPAGTSLLSQPPISLISLMGESEDEEGQDLKNNTQVLHKVAFAHIKRTTGKRWSERTQAQEYEQAVKIARNFLAQLRQELRNR